MGAGTHLRPGARGDVAKAQRIMETLPMNADWLTTLRQRPPMSRVAVSVSSAAHKALESLACDTIEFLDPDVRAAYRELESALGTLCDEFDGLFTDDGSHGVVPPEWKHEQPDRYYGAIADLSTARDLFLEGYDRLVNLLNAKDLLRWPVPAGTTQYVQYVLGGAGAQGASVTQSVPGPESPPKVPEHLASGPPSYLIGQGAPHRAHEFRAAYEALRQHVSVGWPAGDVFGEGPGLVQRFTADETSRGWVLCALPDGPVVAVADAVWSAVLEAGGAAFNGDAVAAVGFPVEGATGTETLPVIDEQADQVELRGGDWGHGRLVRAPGNPNLAWQPVPTIDFGVTAAARDWASITTSTPPDLRIRAVATLPWEHADTLEITAERRRELVERLPLMPLTSAVDRLFQPRPAGTWFAPWAKVPGANALTRAGYVSVVSAPDGRPALTSAVMVGIRGSAVVTCAELRVEDVTGWNEALDTAGGTAAPDERRLRIDGLRDFFVAAWETATEVLPMTVLESRATSRWTGVPKVELILSAEGDHGQAGRRVLLGDLVDFTAFGECDHDRLSRMSVAISAAPGLPGDERQTLTRQALVKMGLAFGFLDASLDRL